MPSVNKLIAQLGVPIADQRLIKTALTHRSFLYEHPERVDTDANERLEFLGDAVLDFLASTLVFERFPIQSEGQLSELRAVLVKTATLADYARSYDLGAYVRLSRGEESSGARRRESLLADTFEAVMAAVYLDGGMEPVRAIMLPLFEQRLAQVDPDNLRLDYRSMLQERIQSARGITPRYATVGESGPDHRREYTVEVRIDDQVGGVGSGNSKQSAAQAAARAALEALDREAGA